MPDLLSSLGWSDRWSALLAEHPGAEAARVVRHDGTHVLVTSADGSRAVPRPLDFEPDPVVGDWLAIDGDEVRGVLDRTGLLRRRAADNDQPQPVAANVDVVVLVNGLDRPIRPGRIDRGVALAWDGGASAVVVLTKSAIADGEVDVAAATARRHPGVEVLVTSAVEGLGMDELRQMLRGGTAVLLGESGAGKSSIVNALLGTQAAAVGEVREGDAKGRHTTTARSLHVIPSGGVIIDTPGTRALGLWVEVEAVDATFGDIESLGQGCRFADCHHEAEPGCAVQAAVADGSLAVERFDAWRDLRAEVEAATRRHSPHEQRRHERKSGRLAQEGRQAKRKP